MTFSVLPFSELDDFNKEILPEIERGVEKFLPAGIELSLVAGERNSAKLLLLSGMLFGGNRVNLLPASVAVEFVKLASDVFASPIALRSENPNLEIITETRNISSGVLLLNAAYGLLFVNHADLPDRSIRAHGEFVECIGSDEFSSSSEEFVRSSIVMQLALRVGAILAGAEYVDVSNISRFGQLMGEAYTIVEKHKKDQSDEKIGAIENFEVITLVDEAKRVLLENFAPSTARTILVQFADNICGRDKADDFADIEADTIS